MTYLIALTLATICWALWVRRITWTCKWEVAATLNLALQGVAVALMSPIASETVGHWLHDLTGYWNLEDYVAHDCYIVAASAIVYNTIGRLGNDKIMQRRFALLIEKPATLCIPLMLATLSMGNGVRVYAADFFDAPMDLWLTLYWTVMCGTLLWLLGYGFRMTMIVGRDPRNRGMAHIYLAATTAGIIACMVQVATAYTPAFQGKITTYLVWVFACLCGLIFAVASGYSWLRKTRGFRRLMVVVR